MTLFHRGRSSVPVAGCLIAAIALCGCEDSSKSTGDDEALLRPARPVSLEQAANAESGESAPVVPAEGSPDAIASQFERDMAAFRALRGDAGGSTGAGSGSIPTATPAGGAGTVGEGASIHGNSGGSSRVIFNEPDSSVLGAPPGGGVAAPTTHTDRSAGWDPNAPFGRRDSDPITSGAGAESAAPGLVEDPSDPGDAQARLREATLALRRELFQHASFDDAPLREYLAMAALSMVEPERTLDPDALYDLDDREKELVRAYQSFFQKLGAELTASGDEEALVKLVDELKLAIVDRGPLRIARAELCTRVDGFGRYTPFDKYSFLAGNGQDVVIYSEIEEFTSQENDKGEWVTDLWQELIIYNTHDNVPVWHQEWRAAPDVSSRKRQDFFISYVVTLPERLTVGQYTLKVRVRDEKSGSIAEIGIPFTIVADEKMAARVPE